MKAVIVIRRGMLEAVYSDDPTLEVVLIDHDDLASAEHEVDEPEVPKAPEGLVQVY